MVLWEHTIINFIVGLCGYVTTIKTQFSVSTENFVLDHIHHDRHDFSYNCFPNKNENENKLNVNMLDYGPIWGLSFTKLRLEHSRAGRGCWRESGNFAWGRATSNVQRAVKDDPSKHVPRMAKQQSINRPHIKNGDYTRQTSSI